MPNHLLDVIKAIGTSVNEEALVADAKLEDRILLQLKSAYQKPLLNKSKKLFEADEEHKTPLMWAVNNGNYIAVQWLLEEMKKNNLLSSLETKYEMEMTVLNYAVSYKDLDERMSLRRRILQDVLSALNLCLSTEAMNKVLRKAIGSANQHNNLYFLQKNLHACKSYIEKIGFTGLIIQMHNDNWNMDFAVLSFWVNNPNKYNFRDYGICVNVRNLIIYYHNKGEAYFKLVYTGLLNDPTNLLSHVGDDNLRAFLFTILSEADLLQTLAVQSFDNHCKFLSAGMKKRSFSLPLLEKIVSALILKLEHLSYIEDYVPLQECFSLAAFRGLFTIVKALLPLRPKFKFDARVNLPCLIDPNLSVQYVKSEPISNIICFLHFIKISDAVKAREFAAKIPLEDREHLEGYFQDAISKMMVNKILAETSVLNEVQVEGEGVSRLGLFSPQPGSPGDSAHFQHLVGFFNLAKKQLEEFAQMNPGFAGQVAHVLRGGAEVKQNEIEQEGKEAPRL